MLLLEQDTTRKRRMNKFLLPEFEPGNDKDYEMKEIRNSAIYAKEVEGHLLGLYYLIV